MVPFAFKAYGLHFDIRYLELRFQALRIKTEVTVNLLRERDGPPFESSFIVPFCSLTSDQVKAEIKLNFEISFLGTPWSGDSRPGKFLASDGLGS